MIQVHNLKKKFDDFQALNGVEMHVGKGDIYGLVGPNAILPEFIRQMRERS